METGGVSHNLPGTLTRVACAQRSEITCAPTDNNYIRRQAAALPRLGAALCLRLRASSSRCLQWLDMQLRSLGQVALAYGALELVIVIDRVMLTNPETKHFI